ncbi:MAG: riboflavin synthase [Solirubrobacterales bacterium]|nr:riboflavin synthase [Solirubrobacterales bacterium]MBV9837887.1 riboflavin synthase [Solirubrobacterales bacterium]
MFTGLVQGLGQVVGVDRGADGLRLTVDSPLSEELAEGDSIAVNGVCLTATELDGGAFVAELMNETVARSSLGGVQHGARVNLELPLRATDRLGGHLVQGHVDGVGTVTGLAADGFAREVEIAAPADVMRYVVRKGSIAVDGVSLTVAGLREASFTVSLIPQTLERTNLGQAELGTKVNLEVDVLAKYVERLMEVSR